MLQDAVVCCTVCATMYNSLEVRSCISYRCRSLLPVSIRSSWEAAGEVEDCRCQQPIGVDFHACRFCSQNAGLFKQADKVAIGCRNAAGIFGLLKPCLNATPRMRNQHSMGDPEDTRW